jgi:sugar phosphate permease
MQKEMQLDNAALGWLFSVFYYTYTLAQFAIGLFLDRSNLRWTFAAAVLAWSVVAGLTSLASGFAALLAFRLLWASPNRRTGPPPCGLLRGPFRLRTGRSVMASSPVAQALAPSSRRL